MSDYNFHPNQKVKVIKSHNHIIADDTEYRIGQMNRICGAVSVQIMKDGKCVGAINESCLEAIK